jgi:hypothetical protein
VVYIKTGEQCARRVACNVSGQNVTSGICLIGQLILVHINDWCPTLSVFSSCLEFVVELKRKDLVTAVLNHMCHLRKFEI